MIWIGIDLAVTGDPLHSQHATSETVAALDRGEELAELPGALAVSMTELVKPPVILAGLAGIALAVVLVPRRAADARHRPASPASAPSSRSAPPASP